MIILPELLHRRARLAIPLSHPQRHRAHVLPPEGLPTRRDPLRPQCRELPRRSLHRGRRQLLVMSLDPKAEASGQKILVFTRLERARYRTKAKTCRSGSGFITYISVRKRTEKSFVSRFTPHRAKAAAGTSVPNPRGNKSRCPATLR